VPSSASVAVISNGTASPNEKKPPSAGELISTDGAALPTTIVTSSLLLRPVLSVTVSVAVYVPTAPYVWVGFGSADFAVPSPKSHS
jgi:hypothetical protein